MALEAKRRRLSRTAALKAAVIDACGLLARTPDGLSASDPRPGQLAALGLATVLAGLLSLLALGWHGPTAVLALLVFTLTAGLRLLAALTASATGRSGTGPCQPPEPDGPVPMISVVVALYREDDVLPGLLVALEALRWPRARREIVLLVEEDDVITRRALHPLARRHAFRTLVIPDCLGPRTKPRALQTALPFLRGSLISVYDAEDRPHRNQLVAAAGAFARGGPGLGVVQAPLVAQPDRGSWIGQQFALDYAVWFRLVLPLLSRLSGLLPLGGTSNHFRRGALEAVGGWDPWNLTEDADLGVRLARYGWRAELIEPPTIEEAPPHLAGWLRQRARWVHGHIQTLAIHLRDPVRCWKALGLRGSCAMLVGLMLGPLAALGRLVAVVGLPLAALRGDVVGVGLVFAGLACEGLAGCIAARHDGRRELLKALPGLPLYFLLQSLATLLALRGLLVAPHHWAKTEHGLRARGASLQRAHGRDSTDRAPGGTGDSLPVLVPIVAANHRSRLRSMPTLVHHATPARARAPPARHA